MTNNKSGKAIRNIERLAPADKCK